MTRARKPTDVIGYTFDGAGYCAECGENLPPEDEYGEAPDPILVSDHYYITYEEFDGTVSFRSAHCYSCGEDIE
jgi:hypothetical protein